VYERNGVTVSSFPVIHALNGALGYKIEFGGRTVVFSGDTDRADTSLWRRRALIYSSMSPSSHLRSWRVMDVDVAIAANMVKMAHTVPDQVGQIFDMTQPRMAALWHLDLRPGVDAVFDEIGNHYDGAGVASRDLTVYNVTESAVTARQAVLDPMAPIIKGPTGVEPTIDPPNVPPEWWADALLPM
jgi:ribonuclease Z